MLNQYQYELSRRNSVISVALNPKQLNEKLDTVRIEYTREFHLLENLTSKLIALDETGEYKLELASSIVKKNNTEYLIQIKETYFSNGEKITLEDVMRTLDRAVKYGT